ncbi:hypothetical protein R8Z50_10815 [Longispora sp. K20-0274]|uniref:hypothetical protein n=1 Tax=Longispora sp. K20-0274 TaxID=3088255 RepID=UPI00399A5233
MTAAEHQAGDAAHFPWVAVRAGVFAAVVFGMTVAADLLFVAHQPAPRAVIAWLAGSAGALAAMLIARTLRAKVRRPLLWLVAGQFLAVAPDIALAAGIAHRGWMNVFVGHLVLDGGPGGALVWLAVVAVLAIGYATLLPASAPTRT